MMRLLSVFLFSITALLQLTDTAEAYEGFNLSVGSLYYNSSVKNETTNTKTTQKEWLQNVRAGYVFENTIYLGAVYDTHESGDDSDLSMTGASLGFTDEGDFIIFHYFVSSKYQLDASTKAEKGSGFGVDMGTYHPIWKDTLYMGWQLSYRKINYDEAQLNGVATNDKYEYSNFCPMIILGFVL